MHESGGRLLEPIAPSFLSFEERQLRVLFFNEEVSSEFKLRGFVHQGFSEIHLFSSLAEFFSTKWQFRFLNRSELEEGGKRRVCSSPPLGDKQAIGTARIN